MKKVLTVTMLLAASLLFGETNESNNGSAKKVFPVSNFTRDSVPMLVPRVQKYAAASGVFKFDRLTVAVPDGEELIVEQLAESLKRFPNVTVAADKETPLCRFVLSSDKSLPSNGQGYTLTVATDGITVASRTTDGLFHGAQIGRAHV